MFLLVRTAVFMQKMTRFENLFFLLCGTVDVDKFDDFFIQDKQWEA